MSEAALDDPAFADTLLAVRLFAHNPQGFGGLVLRGYGPVRDALMVQMLALLDVSRPFIKIPINVDTEQLVGGLDLTETLAAGRAVRRPGLIERAQHGVAIVPMAERISTSVAAHLAQAMDRGELGVILLDDGIESDETAPAVLMERAAFHCDLAGGRDLVFDLGDIAVPMTAAPMLSKSQRSAIAATASALGIESVRPIVLAEKCAAAIAAAAGPGAVEDDHLQSAIRLVLAPRATRIPQHADEETPPPPPEPEQSQGDSDPSEDDQNKGDIPLDDLLLAAAEAAIPQHILDGIAKGTVRSSGGQSGKSGQKEKSAKRGRPRGSLPGMPGDGRKLALIDTLRAAAPWQAIRRMERGDPDRRDLIIRTSDLRIRRFEQNRESLTIFAVDASGSSALSRLAEAKGAVELMLAQAHVKRSQVALIAFRQAGAEILLPPTRSLTRARRALSALPGGGGTPLAAGLLEARLLADAANKRGQTPTIALLTDGKANVTLSGDASRAVAMQESDDVAKAIAAAGHHAIVIDISPRPRQEAAELAAALRGKYLALPRANSAAMVEAIDSISAETSA